MLKIISNLENLKTQKKNLETLIEFIRINFIKVSRKCFKVKIQDFKILDK